MNRRKNGLLRRPVTMVVLFILFVILPGIALSLIGVRSLSRENAFLEKQLTTALSLEIKPAVKALEQELQTIQDELDMLFQNGLDRGAVQKKETLPDSSLISFPYRLSQKRDILQPKFEGELTEEQYRFFRFNRDFFQDRVSVAIYKRVPIQQKNDFGFGSSSKGSSKYSKKSKSTSRSKSVKRGDFTNTLEYQVQSQESLQFSQIISEKKSGLILREIDGEQMLLYFSQIENSEIIGAVISIDRIKERLISLLPTERNRERIILLTDQNDEAVTDTPADIPESEALVELSIGKYLPMWHLTAFLTDPGMIERQAQFNGTIIGLMIALLLISLTIGGVLIIRIITLQLRDAEQKTSFVANVSHELKTPLTSIRLFAELLQQGRQTDPDKQKRYLAIMVSESERLTRLINNVLDFSRGNSKQKQYHKRNIDISEMVSELLENQKVRLEHNRFTLETDISANELIVDADPEALKQVLLNLLSNAEKYSNGERWIAVSLRREQNYVKICVKDHGIGIDASLRKKVFHQFYRVDTSLTAPVQGTGLGLTISRNIIRDHGGDIVCSSNPHGGACFTITVPLEEKRD